MKVADLVAVAALATVALALVVRCDALAGPSRCDDSVAPGVACNDPTLCCSWPTTECGRCACNGSSYECQERTCSPEMPCPLPGTLTSGQTCPTSQTGCFAPIWDQLPSSRSCKSTALAFPCGGNCVCGDGVWTCNALDCPDAGTEPNDADTADGTTSDATAE